MISRRRFMKFIGMFGGFLAAFPGRKAQAESLSLPLEKVDILRSTGGSVILRIKGKEVLFIRDSETTVRALSPTCTHKGCKVAYKKGENRIECPCHGSRYDVEGKVLKGPATKDLKSYDAELKDQHIVFSFR